MSQEIEQLKDLIEQLQVQLAGCSVAALGYGKRLPRKAFGYSASYGDVLRLRRAFEAAVKAGGPAAEDAARRVLLGSKYKLFKEIISA